MLDSQRQLAKGLTCALTLCMWGVYSIPTTKSPINVATFVSYVLPPLLFYCIMAVMVIMSRTRALRTAFWPVVALLAFRAAISVVIVSDNSKLKFRIDLTIPAVFIVTRSLYWALVKKPLVRQLRPANSTPSTLMDAFDLALSFRGYGWDWSRGLYVPRETRPSSRIGFISYVILSMATHGILCGILYRALRSFSPVGLGSIAGGSIFDETLPFHVRYFRSSIISVIGCFAAYSFLQMAYDLCTIVGVLFLGQDPAQWPPAFDAPWSSTSLTEFWGRRWHQWLRHLFLVQGGYPLSFVFGRAGFVIGAFLSSAVYHHIGLYSLDERSDLWRMLVGFGIMAPGILAERAFRQLTGKKVCGLTGWVWTMSWLVLWGNLIIDGFARAALFRFGALVDLESPFGTLVERQVINFDTLLHVVQN